MVPTTLASLANDGFWARCKGGRVREEHIAKGGLEGRRIFSSLGTGGIGFAVGSSTRGLGHPEQ